MERIGHLPRSYGGPASGRWFGFALLAATLVSATNGCSTFRKQKAVPDSVATCRQLSYEGIAAMELGHWEHAHELLDKAVKTSPGDVDARQQLAEVLWRSGSRDEAVVHMQTAVSLDPERPATVVRCGEMLLGLGASDRALARAEEAIALDGTLAGGWALRGRVYRQQGDLERSLADLQQALGYSPNAGDILQDAAEVQYQLGRPQRSLATIQHLLDTAPEGARPREALWLAGLAYGAVDRREEAVASLYAATLRGDPHPELLYQLARAQSVAGRPGEAAVTVRQALTADGKHQPSQELLAQLEAGGERGVDVPLRR